MTGTYIIYTHDVIKLGGQTDAGTPEDQGLRIDGVNNIHLNVKMYALCRAMKRFYSDSGD